MFCVIMPKVVAPTLEHLFVNSKLESKSGSNFSKNFRKVKITKVYYTSYIKPIYKVIVNITEGATEKVSQFVMPLK
jgi:hypothetical protein